MDRHATGEAEDCPRAAEDGVTRDGPFKFGPECNWQDDRCSYCGSISSASFIKAMEDGCKLTPTDKNYKVYVDLPGRSHAKFYFQHLSMEGCDKFIELHNAMKLKLAEPGYFYTAPYFVKFEKKET